MSVEFKLFTQQNARTIWMANYYVTRVTEDGTVQTWDVSVN